VPICSSCGRENRADARFCDSCGADLAAAAAREQRKTVTVLFCDVTGSTALGESTDPEAVRALLAGYFERMKGIVESHGGQVEKFVGDAVMAVFGVPVTHEDDALRAVRAALEMREALPGLGVQARIGVNTGEVVTGTTERLATGDALNVAARLEQAATPGEVLIGAGTLRLVREAVEVEPIEPLVVKGKAEPVSAHRLLSVHEPPERRLEAPMVGRERELAQVRAAYDQAVTDRACRLFTVVGEAGVGKSRLVREFLPRREGTLAVGRCLPYGEGITYGPVVEVLKQLRVRPSEPAAAAAVGSLLGEREGGASAEEVAWAFRKILEQAATERPLVCVFDDIQWGEQTFLDLVEHVALLSSGAPILLVCMARHELTERRPDWPVALRLEPLPDEAVERLLPETIDDDLRDRIARAAGGNPLFVEEMVAFAAEAGGDVVVPPTLRALLAARLDQLPSRERRVLECAAVEGEVFHRGAVQALVMDGEVTPQLAALARRQLISPHPAQLAGEDGFRFRHLLIRDAAYESLTKTSRAELHQRFAAWLEERGTELVELSELVGYHLEQAARYRTELGQPDVALAEQAGERLAAAGRRTLWRGDPAAASLLERALVLIRPLRLDVKLEVDLAEALSETDPRKAAAVAQATAERARAAGDEPGELLASVVAAHRRSDFAADPDVEGLEALAHEALPVLEQTRDHAGLVHVWRAIGLGVANPRGHFEEIARAAERAIRHSRLAGQRDTGLLALAFALAYGPRPADEALQTLDAALPETPHPQLVLSRAVLLAMLGRFDEAWQLAHEASGRWRDITGDEGGEAMLAEIARLAGAREAAARYFRTYCDLLDARGQRGFLSTFAPMLGRELCALGRYDEAESLAQLGRKLGSEQDVATQMLWRRVQALVHASRGEHDEAETLARKAVALAERSDSLSDQGEAFSDLAEVLHAAARTDEAAVALEQALDRYERKKNLAMVAQVRPRLEAMRAEALSG
jgi:class 3 adenylate cyclase/tetratricopeptide (TPR) repeat protein